VRWTGFRDAVNRVQGRGPRECGAPYHFGPSVHGSTAGILLREGVCYDLIGIVHRETGGQDFMKWKGTPGSNLSRSSMHEQPRSGVGRRVVRGGAMGASSELSLELAPVTHFLRGLHLHGLRKMGTPTEVLAGINDCGCELATRRRANRTSARSRWWRTTCSGEGGRGIGDGPGRPAGLTVWV
jgi:hypothetical protein